MGVKETCINGNNKAVEENVLEILEFPVLKILKKWVTQTTGMIYEYSYFDGDERDHLKYPIAI